MATIKLYLDTRRTKEGPAPLKIAISHGREKAFISLDQEVKAEEWDATRCVVVNSPKRVPLNSLLHQRMLEADLALLAISARMNIRTIPAKELRRLMMIEMGLAVEDNSQSSVDIESLFVTHFKRYIETRNKPRTAEIYQTTWKRICEYDLEIESRHFEDITRDWLTGFDRFLMKTSPAANARAIHLRNIRAVFNAAIDDEITVFYPFRKFKIQTVATAKRSLTVEQLRQFMNYPVEETEEQYRDMFMLIFYLIGINTVDLLALKKVTDDGYIEYVRSKTSKLYRIKVEPEAMAIIDKYRGKNWLLNVMDRYKDYKDYGLRLNKHLKHIGEIELVRTKAHAAHYKKVFHPLFPDISTYWARHTWATIAASLDIPKETIAAALGHEIGSKITSIYIDFDQRKVEEANRKVIDHLLQKTSN